MLFAGIPSAVRVILSVSTARRSVTNNPAIASGIANCKCVSIVSIVVPFWLNQLYLGSYKVTPKRNYNGDYRWQSRPLSECRPGQHTERPSAAAAKTGVAASKLKVRGLLLRSDVGDDGRVMCQDPVPSFRSRLSFLSWFLFGVQKISNCKHDKIGIEAGRAQLTEVRP